MRVRKFKEYFERYKPEKRSWKFGLLIFLMVQFMNGVYLLVQTTSIDNMPALASTMSYAAILGGVYVFSSRKSSFEQGVKLSVAYAAFALAFSSIFTIYASVLGSAEIRWIIFNLFNFGSTALITSATVLIIFTVYNFASKDDIKKSGVVSLSALFLVTAGFTLIENQIQLFSSNFKTALAGYGYSKSYGVGLATFLFITAVLSKPFSTYEVEEHKFAAILIALAGLLGIVRQQIYNTLMSMGSSTELQLLNEVTDKVAMPYISAVFLVSAILVYVYPGLVEYHNFWEND